VQDRFPVKERETFSGTLKKRKSVILGLQRIKKKGNEPSLRHHNFQLGGERQQSSKKIFLWTQPEVAAMKDGADGPFKPWGGGTYGVGRRKGKFSIP